MRIITSPTVQLGLHPLYPLLGRTHGERQFVGIHRRQPPGIPELPLLTCWLPWPCGRLSRPPRWVATPTTTTEPPPHPTALSRQRTRPPSDWPSDRKGDHGWFPRSLRHRSVREAPSSTPTASPRLRRRPSTWPPHRFPKPASELTPARRRRSRAARRPISTRLEPVSPITELQPLVHSRYTF